MSADENAVYVALLAGASEKEDLDFKSTFEEGPQGWCELVKDIVAMANTAGGCILIGIDNDGRVVKGGYRGVIDPADISNKVRKYTGVNLPGIQVQAHDHEGERILAITVPAHELLMPFASPGTYAAGEGRQKSAFAQGTVYFRHGSKSEPGTMEDFAAFSAKLTERVREAWVDRLRLVSEAPMDAVLRVVPATDYGLNPSQAVGVQLVNDPSAPKVPAWSPDDTHPYRQKELVREVGKMLPKGTRFNGHDVLCLRRVHNIDKNPNFYHKPVHGSPQYSPALRDWILEKHAEDPEFLSRSREQHYARRKSG